MTSIFGRAIAFVLLSSFATGSLASAQDQPPAPPSMQHQAPVKETPPGWSITNPFRKLPTLAILASPFVGWFLGGVGGNYLRMKTGRPPGTFVKAGSTIGTLLFGYWAIEAYVEDEDEATARFWREHSQPSPQPGDAAVDTTSTVKSTPRSKSRPDQQLKTLHDQVGAARDSFSGNSRQ